MSPAEDRYIEMPSGLLLPRSVAEEKARADCNDYTGVSLFSGCGGFDCGMVQAGWKVLAAVEYDCTAVHTYMANLCRWGEVKMHFITPADEKRFNNYLGGVYKRHGLKISKDGDIIEDGKVSLADMPRAGNGMISGRPLMHGTLHIFVGDIRKLETQRVLDAIGLKKGELGCVFGGPPCQGYSHAGKRDVMDPRNSLVFEWARFVAEMSPRTCVMENVPGIVNMVTDAGVPVLDELCMILEKGDFGVRDMFRRSIEQQTGIGLVRGKKRSSKAPEPEPEPEDDSSDDLFSFADAAD